MFTIVPFSPQVFRSEDDGKTWQQMPERVEFGAGRLFLHEEKPYFLGVGPDLRGDIRISRRPQAAAVNNDRTGC